MMGTERTALLERHGMEPAAANESGGIRLSGYVRPVPLATPEQSCSEIQRLFSDHADSECLIVCEEAGKPLGLVMRDRFYMNISRRFGVELFYGKAVHTLMDKNSITVDIDASPHHVIELAMQRGDRHQYDCIIVTDNEKAIGVLTMADLLRLSRELQRKAVLDVTERVRGELADSQAVVNEVRLSALNGNKISANMSELTLEGRDGLGRVAQTFERLAANSAHQEEAMNGLEREVRQVEDATAAIKQLAEQSRMLALNAAIEAARAGQFGKGFSVVADEVKKLANETERTAELITKQIGAIAAAIAHTAGLAREGREESKASAAYVEEAVRVFGRLFQAAGDNRSSAEAIGRLAEEAYAGTVKAAEQLDGLLD